MNEFILCAFPVVAVRLALSSVFCSMTAHVSFVFYYLVNRVGLAVLFCMLISPSESLEDGEGILVLLHQ